MDWVPTSLYTDDVWEGYYEEAITHYGNVRFHRQNFENLAADKSAVGAAPCIRTVFNSSISRPCIKVY